MTDVQPRRSHRQDKDKDRQTRKRERRRSFTAVVLALLLIGGLAAGVVYGARYVWDRVSATSSDDYAGPGGDEVVIEVNAGDSLTAIGRTLEAKDVVASTTAFIDAANGSAEAAGVQPGTYALREQMKASDALTLLLDPASRVESKVTLREGLRLTDTLTTLAQETGVPEVEYTAAAKDAKALGLPAYAKGNAEGFLFPATYTFPPDTGAPAQLAAAVARYKQSAAKTGLDKGVTIDGTDYSPLEVLTVASILEKEAPPEAMADVARVLYNRLDIDQALQLDSTVSYVTGKGGVTTTEEDRQLDSPYNTYANPGLPPGPITSPGDAAMAAAMKPAESDNLYFVTVNPDTGETKFAETYNGHLKNVEEFRAWLRENPE